MSDAEPGHVLPDRLPRPPVRHARLARPQAGPASRSCVPQMFGNYRRLVYLAQTDDAALDARAARRGRPAGPRVRAAADRDRRARGAARRCSPDGASAVAAALLGARSARRWPRLLADPIFEVIPLRNLEEQAAHLPPGALVSVTASPAQGPRGDARLGGAAGRGRPPRDPPPLRADGPRPCRARRAARAGARGRADAGVRGRRRRRRSGRLPGRPLAAAGDGGAGAPVRRRWAAPPIRRATPRSPGRRCWPRSRRRRRSSSHVTTQMDFDAARRRGLGPRAAARPASRLDVVVGVPGVADPERLAGDRRPDRRRGHEAIPEQEPAVRDGPRAVRWPLPADGVRGARSRRS